MLGSGRRLCRSAPPPAGMQEQRSVPQRLHRFCCFHWQAPSRWQQGRACRPPSTRSRQLTDAMCERRADSHPRREAGWRQQHTRRLAACRRPHEQHPSTPVAPSWSTTSTNCMHMCMCSFHPLEALETSAAFRSLDDKATALLLGAWSAATTFSGERRLRRCSSVLA